MSTQTVAVQTNPTTAAFTLTDLLSLAIELHDREKSPLDKQRVHSLLVSALHLAEAGEQYIEQIGFKAPSDSEVRRVVGPRPDFTGNASTDNLPYMKEGRNYRIFSPPEIEDWTAACDEGSRFAATFVILLTHDPADPHEVMKGIARRLCHDEQSHAYGFTVGFYHFLSVFLEQAAKVIDPWALLADIMLDMEEEEEDEPNRRGDA